MENGIFAYRIGENLFCPDCIEKAEKRLPKKTEVQLTKKPLTFEDIDLYICKECRKVFEKKDLIDIQDFLNESLLKIRFVDAFFGHDLVDDEYLGLKDSVEGLCLILRDIQENIEQAIRDIDVFREVTGERR